MWSFYVDVVIAEDELQKNLKGSIDENFGAFHIYIYIYMYVYRTLTYYF